MGEKSVFSQKSRILSVRGSQKMPPSVFGRPTYRDLDAAKDIFRTVDERKPDRNNSIDVPNPLSALVDEVTGGEANNEGDNLDQGEAMAEENPAANDII